MHIIVTSLFIDSITYLKNSSEMNAFIKMSTPKNDYRFYGLITSRLLVLDNFHMPMISKFIINNNNNSNY